MTEGPGGCTKVSRTMGLIHARNRDISKSIATPNGKAQLPRLSASIWSLKDSGATNVD
ncbi:hypothetical protein ACVWXP_003754 [Bradyrhizobium sp. USDA 4463]